MADKLLQNNSFLRSIIRRVAIQFLMIYIFIMYRVFLNDFVLKFSSIVFLQQVGPHFLKAIEPSLKEIWSSDLKESWTQLFAYISYQMKNALTAAEKAKRGSK